MAHTEDIKKYILKNFLYDTDKPLDNGASLLDAGVVDSTGILEIIGHVETEYGIKVNDDEILPENFDSIDRISAFVGRKRSLSQVG